MTIKEFIRDTKKSVESTKKLVEKHIGNIENDNKSLAKELNRYLDSASKLMKWCEEHEGKEVSEKQPKQPPKTKPIRDDVAEVLGYPQGSEVTPTDLRKKVVEHLKTNNFYDEEKKLYIPDDATCELMKFDTKEIEPKKLRVTQLYA